MIPLNSYSGIEYRLNQVCPKKLKCCIVGILFANPHHNLVKEEFLPFLKQFDLDSQGFTHIFFAGYISEKEKHSYEDAEYVLQGPNGINWYFSHKAFKNIQEEFHSMTTWHFSGGVDLLLFDAIRDSSQHWHSQLSLNLNRAVILDLLRARNKGDLPHICQFLTPVFQEAKQHEGTCIARIQQLGLIEGRQSVIEFFLKMFIPYDIIQALKSSFLYIARDISLKDKKGSYS